MKTGDYLASKCHKMYKVAAWYNGVDDFDCAYCCHRIEGECGAFKTPANLMDFIRGCVIPDGDEL